LAGWQQGRHANDLFGATQVKIHDERGATPVHDRFQSFLPGATANRLYSEILKRGFQRLKRPFVVTQDSGSLAHELQSTGRGEVGKCHPSNHNSGYRSTL
jgi:hypothetical protein